MFCGNCGSKAVEGNRFCITCGQAHADAALEESGVPAAESVAVNRMDGPPSTDQSASPGVPVVQPGEKPLYCRHNAPARTRIGVDRENGSEICLGCKLPYSPGSPNSRLAVVAHTTTRAGVKPNGNVSEVSDQSGWLTGGLILVGGLCILLVLVIVGQSRSNDATKTVNDLMNGVAQKDYNDTDTLAAALKSQSSAAVTEVKCLASADHIYDCRFGRSNGDASVSSFVVSADGTSFIAKAP